MGLQTHGMSKCVYFTVSVFKPSPHCRRFGFSEKPSHSSPHACLGKWYLSADRMILLSRRTNFPWVLSGAVRFIPTRWPEESKLTPSISKAPRFCHCLKTEGDASNLCPEKSGSKCASIKAIFYHKKGCSPCKNAHRVIFICEFLIGWKSVSNMS